MKRRSDDPVVLPPATDPEQLLLAMFDPLDLLGPDPFTFCSYDEPVLHLIARYGGVATAHQIIYRFAIYDGKHRGHLVKVIRSLVDRGWLRSTKLDPARGRASRQILALSDMNRPGIAGGSHT